MCISIVDTLSLIPIIFWVFSSDINAKLLSYSLIPESKKFKTFKITDLGSCPNGEDTVSEEIILTSSPILIHRLFAKSSPKTIEFSVFKLSSDLNDLTLNPKVNPHQNT